MNTFGNLIELQFEKDDLSQIIQMDQSYFPHPWSLKDWENLKSEHYISYAWQNGATQAFAVFHRVGQDELAHLLKICVLPKFQGTGLTQGFWSHLVASLRMKKIQSIFLEVEKTNLIAIKFYQKAGFEMLREIQGFYSNGATAVTMKLML